MAWMRPDADIHMIDGRTTNVADPVLALAGADVHGIAMGVTSPCGP